MRKIWTLALALGVFAPNAFAQNCSKYYPMEEGKSMEYTSYDRKDKIEGIVTYTVSDVVNEGGKTIAKMNLEHKDKNGKVVYESDYTFSCEENVVKIDFSSMMNQQMMEAAGGGDMEMEMTGTDIELPNNLSVGQTLPDANVNMRMNMGAMSMNMAFDMVNRKVESQESITTQAGTFDCFVISSDNKAKMMMANTSHTSKMWLAEGFGMIRQDIFNKNGKLMSKVVLTRFTE
ncbi:MAG: hypothetical protein KJN96_07300 [Eudoraea sp.]|nr:hypothetical protein [Eudoraea sp.]